MDSLERRRSWPHGLAGFRVALEHIQQEGGRKVIDNVVGLVSVPEPRFQASHVRRHGDIASGDAEQVMASSSQDQFSLAGDGEVLVDALHSPQRAVAIARSGRQEHGNPD